MRNVTVAAVLILASTLARAGEHEPARRTESATSPFTYEALGATPSLRFGRQRQEKPQPLTAGVQRVQSDAAPPQAIAHAVPHPDLRGQQFDDEPRP